MYMSTKKGFTLVELLVSVGLFGIVVATATGIFTSALRGQRALVALMAANDNVELTLEQAAREVRTGFSFVAPSSGRLEFTNARGEAVAYEFDALGKRVVREVDGVALPITGRNVSVERLRFLLDPQLSSPTNSPRITIVIQVTPTLKAVEGIATNLQVTITPRS